MKYCKWCDSKINSKKKEYCNLFCYSNYFEMVNIQLPRLWVKRLENETNNQNKIKEIIKYSTFHKVDPELLIKKLKISI